MSLILSYLIAPALIHAASDMKKSPSANWDEVINYAYAHGFFDAYIDPTLLCAPKSIPSDFSDAVATNDVRSLMDYVKNIAGQMRLFPIADHMYFTHVYAMARDPAFFPFVVDFAENFLRDADGARDARNIFSSKTMSGSLLEQAVAKLEEENKTLAENTNTHAAENERLMESLDAALLRIEHLEKALAQESERAFEDMEKDNKTLSAENSALKNAAEESDRYAMALTEEMRDAQSELVQKLEFQNERANHLLSEMKTEKERYEILNRAHSDLLSTAKETLRALLASQQCEKADALEIEHITAENEEMLAELERLRAVLTTAPAKDRNEDFAREKAQYEMRIADGDIALYSISEEIKQAEEAQNRMLEAHEETARELRREKENAELARNEIERLREELNEKDVRIGKCESTVAQKEAELCMQEKTLDAMRDSETLVAANERAVQLRCDELEKEIEKLKHTCAESTAVISRLEEENKALLNAAKRMQNIISNK